MTMNSFSKATYLTLTSSRSGLSTKPKLKSTLSVCVRFRSSLSCTTIFKLKLTFHAAMKGGRDPAFLFIVDYDKRKKRAPVRRLFFLLTLNIQGLQNEKHFPVGRQRPVFGANDFFQRITIGTQFKHFRKYLFPECSGLLFNIGNVQCAFKRFLKCFDIAAHRGKFVGEPFQQLLLGRDVQLAGYGCNGIDG